MVATPRNSATGIVRSRVPARLDRLPWSRFHTRLVAGLGICWVLDGIEITVAGAVGAVLSQSDTLHLSAAAVGSLATVYLVGEVIGALVFGQLSDRLGRRKLFMITLSVYLVGSGLTALTLGHGAGWVAYLFATRFIAGAGNGGEVAAMNSAIDEMIPARYRGRVDVSVNGTYWAGAILGTLVTALLLHVLAPSVGWRLGFLLGPGLALAVLYLRRSLPESPRWLLMHGLAAEADKTMNRIEDEVRSSGHTVPVVDERDAIDVRPEAAGYGTVFRVMFVDLWRRTLLGCSLMITQSFLYNAIFFTYALVLNRFYGVSGANAPIYLIAFAVGNLLGPLLLGRLFDTLGRKQMIGGTYILSGGLLAMSAYLFHLGVLTATTQTLAWCVIFFFASAGASAGYLTISEIFPLEVRARAISIIYAVAQLVGAIGPVLYGALIGTGSDPTRLFVGYLVGAGIMVAGGLVELVLGVRAERQPLETVMRPLSAVSAAVPRAGGATALFAPPKERKD